MNKVFYISHELTYYKIKKTESTKNELLFILVI